MTDDPGQAAVRVAGWTVDAAGHALVRGDERRRIEPRAMQLLLRLVADAPSVVTRRALMTDVWGDTYVSDDAVSATVIRLRKAFDDDPRQPTVIETVPKSGYRLVAPVERTLPAPAERPPAAVAPGVAPGTGARIGSVLRISVVVTARGGADVDPEGWLEAMQSTVDEVTTTVAGFGGWVREESNGLLAVFGAPLAQEHHAERALRAALALRDAWPRRLSTDSTVQLRLGVATGPLVVRGEVATPVAVYGEPTRVATALAESAADGEVLVTASAARLRSAEATVTPFATPVPGVDEPVLRLDAVQESGDVWDTRRGLGLTPLHGRADELDQLSTALRRARSGHGQVVVVVGEPGVGKSRLLVELLTRARDDGVRTVVAQASPLDRHSPYAAWAAAISRQLGGLSAEPPPSVDRTALDAVRSPSTVDDGWRATDPDVRHARTVEAVLSLLAPEDVPVVVAVEDVHWADEASRALLDGVVAGIARRPCLLVVTSRPGEGELPAPRSHVSHLWLDPLPVVPAAALLDDLVGVDPSLLGWKQAVLARAGGTPLFLEESVRSAVEAGLLSRSDDGYRATGDLLAQQVPPSIQSLLAERIDRLPAEPGAVVRACAVLGRDSAESVARVVAGVGPDGFVTALAELQSAELIYRTTAGGRPTLVFKHALTQDVAFRGIAASARRELHRRAAAELGRSEATPPEVLAWHLEESGQLDDAGDAWLAAAAGSAQAGSFGDALVHLSHARGLIGPVSDPDARDRRALAIELATGTALVQTVGPADDEVEAAYARARALAERVGAPAERFEAVWGTWFVHLMRGDLAREREFGRQIAELQVLLGDDDSLSLEAHHVQWSGLTLAGRPLEAIRHSDVGIERYRADRHHWLTYSYGGHDPGVCARNLNALAQWMTGHRELAVTRGKQARALADELGHAYSQLESTQALLNVALLDRDADALDEISTFLKELVGAGRLPDVAAGYADGFLGAALAFRGDPAAGAALMAEAAPVWSEFWGAWCFPLDGVFAEVQDAAGDRPAALLHLERCLAWANESGGTWWNAEFLRLIALLSEPPGSARRRSLLADALATATRQGATLLEQRVAATMRDDADSAPA